ncbi:2-deoxyribose-5-phosphate aldolase, partial [candidate division TA06 bacterium]
AGKDLEVKASGGIRDYETAKRMIFAGATRIGVSKGIRIVGKE